MCASERLELNRSSARDPATPVTPQQSQTTLQVIEHLCRCVACRVSQPHIGSVQAPHTLTSADPEHDMDEVARLRAMLSHVQEEHLRVLGE